MKSIALTGATSMIGIALIKQCIQNNIKVVAFIRSDSSKLNRLPTSDLITIINCDLNSINNFDFNQFNISSIDVFYHFGWSHTDKQERFNNEKQLENIHYTLSSVKIAKKMGCKKFIGAGSQAEYGRVLTPLTSTIPVNPENAYGISKYAAGMFAKIECEKLGLVCVWVRILSIYGINDNENTLLKDFIYNCRENKPMPLGPCTHIWDYLHEDDAGRAFLTIGEKAMNSIVYCLGSGIGRHLKEYLEIIKNLVNPSYKIQYCEIPYTEQSLMYLCADISELTKDTGWKPEISFEDGIKKIIDKFSIKNIY